MCIYIYIYIYDIYIIYIWIYIYPIYMDIYIYIYALHLSNDLRSNFKRCYIWGKNMGCILISWNHWNCLNRSKGKPNEKYFSNEFHSEFVTESKAFLLLLILYFWYKTKLQESRTSKLFSRMILFWRYILSE